MMCLYHYLEGVYYQDPYTEQVLVALVTMMVDPIACLIQIVRY